MKKISLRWRLTIMLAALMTVSCLLLNLLISRSAIMRIDEVERYVMEIELANQESIVIDVDDSKTASTNTPSQRHIPHSKHRCYGYHHPSRRGFHILLAGRALAPLRAFSSYMEKLQTGNLSEQLTDSGDWR